MIRQRIVATTISLGNLVNLINLSIPVNPICQIIIANTINHCKVVFHISRRIIAKSEIRSAKLTEGCYICRQD